MSCSIDEVVTMDEVGLDGHDDHIAVTEATALIANDYGMPHIVRTFTNGDLTVTGDIEVKMNAIAQHLSQYDLATGSGDTYYRLAPYFRHGLNVESYRTTAY